MKKFMCVIFLMAVLNVLSVAGERIYFPRDYDPVAVLFDRAGYFLDQKLYYAAARQFEKCANRYPDSYLATEAKIQAGVCYLRLYRYRDADNLFFDVHAELPQYRRGRLLNDLYLNWIKTKISLGEIEKAQELYAAFSMSDPDRYFLSEATFAIAEYFYLVGEKEFATAYLNYHQIFGTSKCYALYLSGIIALEKKEDQLAAELFQQAADFQIDMRDKLDEILMIKDKARYKLALLYFDHHDYEQSIRYYQELENMSLFGADQTLGLAWLYFLTEQYDLAHGQLQMIFSDYSAHPAISEARFLNGIVSLYRNNFDQAIRSFDEFLDMFGKYVTADSILAQRIALEEEGKKLSEQRRKLVELEARLVESSDEEAVHFAREISSRRDRIDFDFATIEKLSNMLNQRESELPLLIEAEYGRAKAQLRMSLLSKSERASKGN
ncbi:MAG: hypothetical protein B6244_07770 [Candidatus Cloacimonetes bacterium 4572_55]|nr:MAG: hypothetical protein B6244_07770 [Candidatus Cloacimonetes bacterium 4572_55]